MLTFQRFVLPSSPSDFLTRDSRKLAVNHRFAPIFREHASGIYVLEFADGTQYVGQALNLGRRFAQHVHGGKHHLPWKDIVAVQILDLPADELNFYEQTTIQELKSAGIKLRNKTYNFAFTGPSVFDGVMAPIDQSHWATGQAEYRIDPIVRAMQRIETASSSKLSQVKKIDRLIEVYHEDRQLSLYEGLLHDIAAYLVHVIPNTVELETIYWSITDMPSTSGGRYYTLNVGKLEVLYTPRQEDVYLFVDDGSGRDDGDDDCYVTPSTCINFPPNSIILKNGRGLYKKFEHALEEIPYDYYTANYALTSADVLIIPAGCANMVLENPIFREPLRQFVIDLMRDGQVSMFRRFHSSILAKEAYAQAVDQYR
ncbi:hypothetical protein JOD55_000551 [Arcanobacterium pluranimalium]|uniref:GIY-YIG nuclease family protein n=1 Tax=Arcanobacterium pluranimalium TaxID=108028 RepID=UPI001959B36F|nr:GIY-YIG nuclease family protein [Arcanobacterium pluranimalium]MBM7824724.1 hypothetical protein [Arcanobacterium pluranimalium]